MKNINDSFLKGRAKSLKYSFNGAFLLLKTEHSIMTQSFIGVVFVALGFYFKITKFEWMFQILGLQANSHSGKPEYGSRKTL